MRTIFAHLALLVAACSTAELHSTPQGAPPEYPSDTPDASDDAGPQQPATNDGGTADLAMSHDVTVQVQPSDNGAALLAAIHDAKTSIHLTMYLLTNDDVVTALGDAKQAGIDVKVILNKKFPPNGGDNLPQYNALKNLGVPVRWASADYTFTHAKTMVIDSATAIVMTMNLTQSSASTNREYIATDSDPDDVADLEKIFAADYADHGIDLPTKLVVSPSGGNDLYSARDHLTAFIRTAKTSLDVEIQTLSDKAIVDAILAAQAANVDVHVVIDGNFDDTSGEATAIAKLKAAGVPLRSLKNPDIHAKAIVVDDQRLFVGSQNMTMTALEQNREIGVLTDADGQAAKVRKVIQADFAKGVDL